MEFEMRGPIEKPRNRRGDLRSGVTAGSGDPRRADGSTLNALRRLPLQSLWNPIRDPQVTHPDLLRSVSVAGLTAPAEFFMQRGVVAVIGQAGELEIHRRFTNFDRVAGP
jgi:hypothetical protein